MKYIVCSDWHLGSDVCHRDKIILLLETIQTENLILNGDIIDINHLKRLNKKDWKILSLLRKLSKHTHIVYLGGNHDTKIGETISDLLGFEFKNNISFSVNKVKYHVQHGDFFDSAVSSWPPFIIDIATGIYYFIQKLTPKSQIIARTVKRHSKGFVKCCENMKKHGEKYAEVNGYDYVISGHSHQVFHSLESKYINEGCFTEPQCSYLEINENGENLIKYI